MIDCSLGVDVIYAFLSICDNVMLLLWLSNNANDNTLLIITLTNLGRLFSSCKINVAAGR